MGKFDGKVVVIAGGKIGIGSQHNALLLKELGLS